MPSHPVPTGSGPPLLVTQAGSSRFELGLSTIGATSPPIDVRRASKIAIAIIIATAKTWSSAVVTLEWGVPDVADPDSAIENWFAFVPTVTLTTSRQSNDRISVSSVAMVRLRVTTAEGANDPEAVVLVHVT